MTAGGGRLTHVGLCVRDLERSVSFYRDALGLEEIGRMHVSDSQSQQLLDLGGGDLDLELVYLQTDGFRIELLGYRRPAVLGQGELRPMNRLGFTHLCFRVDDLDAFAAGIVAHGGTVLPDRDVTFDTGNTGRMALDPDGNRIELISRYPRSTSCPVATTDGG